MARVISLYADRERCRYEFTRPYVGGDTLPQQLQTYVATCARQYAAAPTQFRAPSFAIVQSSGFGKSRLLRELALRTKDNPAADMKVLYTCVRPSNVESSGYPEATAALRDFLFPFVESGARDLEHALTARLVHLYAYAWSHWSSVGSEWFALFDDQADTAICQRLEAWSVADHTTSTQDDREHEKEPRVLVLAIDEARHLLTTYDVDPVGWYKRLSNALVAASRQIRTTFGQQAGIVAVLVDSNPAIIERYDTPPTSRLWSTDSPSHRTINIFPPFTLTQTTNIRFDVLMDDAKRRGLTSSQFYQHLVHSERHEAWDSLTKMGRPMWDRVKAENTDETEEPGNVIQLAATKLLGGLRPDREENFNHESLCGVASVLCRLDLQLSSWSPLAPRLVADFMATLLHVTCSHDQLMTTYTSEPVLTFGAARVWYGSVDESDKHQTLTELILPKFRDLLFQDTFRTGGKECGEDIVGRLVLLLAMDATGAAVASDLDWRAYEYAGAFHSVETFLHVLYGDAPLVVRDCELDEVTSQVDGAVETMLRGWREWQVGFSHFVCLSHAPSEDELWAMLARRAAGVLPREYDYADLVIPIFCGSAVSMVLVQVDSRVSDSDKLWLAARMMRPSAVFTNVWRQRRPEDVVRVYLNVSSSGAGRKSFYLVDEGAEPRQGDEATATESYVLCLDGLDAWSARRLASEERSGFGTRDTIAVLSPGLASELRKLLAPSTMINADVTRNGGRFDMPKAVARNVVARASVEGLLGLGWGDSSDAYGDATPVRDPNAARGHGSSPTSSAASKSDDTANPVQSRKRKPSAKAKYHTTKEQRPAP